MCSPAWAITDPPHAAHEEASSSTAVSRRRSATSSPTRSLTLRDVPRRIAWRVMIPKKISTMLSQLPLASPAVPGQRGRHLLVPATSGWQRWMRRRSNGPARDWPGVRTVFLTPSSGPNFWEWSHAGPRRARHLGRRVSLPKDVRRATSPFDARQVLSVVATPSLKVVHDGVPIGFCCWCSILGGGA